MKRARKLFGFERDGWRAEFDSIGSYLDEYGPRMPQALKDEQQRIADALASATLTRMQASLPRREDVETSLGRA